MTRFRVELIRERREPSAVRVSFDAMLSGPAKVQVLEAVRLQFNGLVEEGRWPSNDVVIFKLPAFYQTLAASDDFMVRLMGTINQLGYTGSR